MSESVQNAAPSSSDLRCNLCGCTEFLAQRSRPGVRCAECNSFERTRLLWMYLEKLPLAPDARVLHLAPELGLYKRLAERVKAENYTVADINPAGYPTIPNVRKMDLCALDKEPSNRYDLIVHAHVLEHTPCNIAYTLYHLHRMMTPQGKHVCVIPFMGGRYDECFATLSDEERTRRFGQFDHVRRFGAKDIDRHLGSVMKLPKKFDATKRFKEEALRRANIPEAMWRGFTGATVLTLSKYDMKLLQPSWGDAAGEAPRSEPSLAERAARFFRGAQA